MRLDRFLSRGRIAELESTGLRGALEELLALPALKLPGARRASILESLIERENVITTYLGHGVAMPHIRLPMGRSYVVAVGRSRAGIPYNSLNGVEQVHLILMLLAAESAKDYLQMLASVARLMRDQEFVDSLLQAPDLELFSERLVAGFSGAGNRPVTGRRNKVNRLVLRYAERIARGSDCTGIMVFGDTWTAGPQVDGAFGGLRTILVTENEPDQPPGPPVEATIHVRGFTRQRLAQLRSALLVGMTRRVIGFRDRLCCVGGVAGSNQFDTVMVVDVEREFQNLLTDPANLLPAGVKPEVFERIIGVATELAVEGREGRPVGTLFVLGDSARVEKLTKPLVLNPFFGYKEEDRSVLNPFMDETLKEFSSLDGAFVIRGDGVVISAGSLILPPPGEPLVMPSGLGARHAAAAAISKATECIAICVSSSGQVTVFRRGLMVPLIEKFGG